MIGSDDTPPDPAEVTRFLAPVKVKRKREKDAKRAEKQVPLPKTVKETAGSSSKRAKGVRTRTG